MSFRSAANIEVETVIDISGLAGVGITGDEGEDGSANICEFSSGCTARWKLCRTTCKENLFFCSSPFIWITACRNRSIRKSMPEGPESLELTCFGQ